MRLLAAVLCFACTAAAAQPFPTKAVRIVVPYPAGGPVDILSRMLSQRLAERWGQPVVVDNRGGAGGIIGTDLVAKAPPDGYTLLWGTGGTHAINPALYRKLPYDALNDFAPVTLIALGTNVLVVTPSLPATSVKELVALAQSRPGRLNFGSAGNGATSHMAGELFRLAAKADLVHVPFKGAAPAIVALVGGQVEMAILDLPAIIPHIRGGRLRALGIASRNRFAGLPDVPTLNEAGLAVEASSWHGLWVPARTPAAVIAAIHSAVVAQLRSAEVGDQLLPLGQERVGNSPEEFSRFIRDERVKWAAVVAKSGAKAD